MTILRLHKRAGNSVGYTLLEILLVIVILSVTTMMVAPSFISVSSPSLRDEANRLVKIVRFASDEVMLSGWPLRLVLQKKGYMFEAPDGEGVWKVASDQFYSSYQLQEPFVIDELRPANGKQESSRSEKRGDEQVVGRVVLLPTGIQTTSEIVLAEHETRMTILIQPGPNGIRIAESKYE